MDLQFIDDPLAFLDVAGDQLARTPVQSTVIASVAERIGHQLADGIPWPVDVPRWFVVVRDGDDIVGTAMRTAPFGEHPAYLMPMPHEAAILLARTLIERGEFVSSANGALPAAQVFADEMARVRGGQTQVAQHTRLFELGTLVAPRPVEGWLRPSGPDDVDLVSAWYLAFGADADEQAGRETGSSYHDLPSREEMLQRIATGRVFLWHNASGTPVNVTAATPPAYGVSRVGPVYTAREHRGRGCASAAVAAVSAWLLARGERPCLFTDQANPTSNKIYEAIGYERVVDMANLRVV